MENQDQQPPNHTTYSANEYRDEVDGNRWRNNEVSQKQEYQSNDGINGQPHQQRGCSREQAQHCYHCYDNYYEHDPFHGDHYTRNLGSLVSQEKSSGRVSSVCMHELPRRGLLENS